MQNDIIQLLGRQPQVKKENYQQKQAYVKIEVHIPYFKSVNQQENGYQGENT